MTTEKTTNEPKSDVKTKMAQNDADDFCADLRELALKLAGQNDSEDGEAVCGVVSRPDEDGRGTNMHFLCMGRQNAVAAALTYALSLLNDVSLVRQIAVNAVRRIQNDAADGDATMQ